MLGSAAAIRVRGDAAAHDLAVSGQPVASVGGDEVGAQTARDAVPAASGHVDPVVACTGNDSIRAERPKQEVRPDGARDSSRIGGGSKEQPDPGCHEQACELHRVLLSPSASGAMNG